MPKKFSYEQPVHFGDVDLGGGLYHPRYLEYFDRARIAALTEIGCPFNEMIANGSVLVVASANITYSRPVMFGQKASIITFITNVSKRSITISQLLSSDPTVQEVDEKSACAKLDVVLVNVDLKRRASAPIDEKLSLLLRGLL